MKDIFVEQFFVLINPVWDLSPVRTMTDGDLAHFGQILSLKIYLNNNSTHTLVSSMTVSSIMPWWVGASKNNLALQGVIQKKYGHISFLLGKKQTFQRYGNLTWQSGWMTLTVQIREVLPYSLSSKTLYPVSTKPIDIALNTKQTIIYFFHCLFSLWLDSSESSKLRIPLKSAAKNFWENLSVETCSLVTKQQGSN